jgi:hypothetical protein
LKSVHCRATLLKLDLETLAVAVQIEQQAALLLQNLTLLFVTKAQSLELL